MGNSRITVKQYDNPKFDSNDPKKEPEVVFEVTKAVNTLDVRIGQIIELARVKNLMAAGHEVTIN